MATLTVMKTGSWDGRVALGQGAFWIGAGLWPMLHLKSFEAVTGPKVDGWLARSFGAMMAVVGSALVVGGARRPVRLETKYLAAASALCLGALDTYFVARRRIRSTYLFDAAVQAGFLTAWAALFVSTRRGRAAAPSSLADSAAEPAALRHWDIEPGETCLPDGNRDLVTEASMESFPCSDPPAIGRNGD